MTQGLGRYLTVGIASNLLNYIFYFSCNLMGASLFISSLAGYLAGLCFSYHFGRTWIFDIRFKVTRHNLIRFFLVYLIGGIAMSGIIDFMNEQHGLSYQLSWIFGAAFAVINNFLGLKFFVFRKN